MVGKGTLDRYCRQDGIGRTSKGHKESISLCIDFVAAMGLKASTEHLPALVQDTGVAVT